MSEVNGPTLVVVGLFWTTSLAFLVHHTYKLDGCRSLVPRRRDWFKGLMMLMLFTSNICLLIWAGTWAYVKYSLGWVRLGPYNARPWPSALFPPQYQRLQTPMTIIYSLAYSLQASLTAEEGLYWAYAMKVTRGRRAAKPFLQSYYFHLWIATSIIITAIQQGSPYFGARGDLKLQTAIETLVKGLLEFLVLVASTVVVLKFPKFLRDVERLGAGPEVSKRLYRYHQFNVYRTFFRFTFCVPLIVIGTDGFTKKTFISLNPILSDLLATTVGASLTIVFMISVLVYLPRPAPSSQYTAVLVGRQSFRDEGGFALMSLLREGGQWEKWEEDVQEKAEERRVVDTAPFTNVEGTGARWSRDGADNWKQTRHPNGSVPKVLESFDSPIIEFSAPQIMHQLTHSSDITAEAQPQRPVQIIMQVEREVHEDRAEARQGFERGTGRNK